MDSSNRRDGRTTLRGTQFPDREIESNAPTRSSERGGSPESVLIYRRRLQRRLGDRPRVRYEHRDQRSGNIEFAGGPSFRTPHGARVVEIDMAAGVEPPEVAAAQ